MNVASRRNYSALRKVATSCDNCESITHRSGNPVIPAWDGPACTWAPPDEVAEAIRTRDIEPYHVFHHRVRQVFGLPCDRDCQERKPYSGESLIERVKAAYRLEEVAGRLTRLYGRGETLTGRCPFHGEQSGRAFVVWVDSQRWRCFGQCLAGGDVVDLVRECKARGLRWNGSSSERNG